MYHKYHDDWIVELLYKDCVRAVVALMPMLTLVMGMDVFFGL